MREITSKYKNQPQIDFFLQNLTAVCPLVLLNLQSNKKFQSVTGENTGLLSLHCVPQVSMIAVAILFSAVSLSINCFRGHVGFKIKMPMYIFCFYIFSH